MAHAQPKSEADETIMDTPDEDARLWLLAARFLLRSGDDVGARNAHASAMRAKYPTSVEQAA